MKTILLRAAMSMLLLVGFTFLVSMTPPTNNDYGWVQDYCKDAASYGWYKNVGACVSEFKVCYNQGNNYAVCACKIERNWLGEYFDDIYGNFGQCVNYFSY